MHKEHLILSPGKSDAFSLLEDSINNIFEPFVKVHIYKVGWRDNAETFDQKMKRLLVFIDEIADKYGSVSLGGISASASFMLNAYMERRSEVKKVVSICGRLRAGKFVFPQLELAAWQSNAFYKSVILSEENQKKMTFQDRNRFMTLSAKFDEPVPRSTSILEGANNLKVPMIGHIFSQAYAIRKMDKEIIDFLTV